MPPRNPARRLGALGVAAAIAAAATPAVAAGVGSILHGARSSPAADAAPGLDVAWSRRLPEHRFSTVAAGAAGEVRVAGTVTEDGLALVLAERADGSGVDLVALDAADGSVAWIAPERAAAGCLPGRGPDGRLWALLRDPNAGQVGNHQLVALDPGSGRATGGGVRARWGQTEFQGCVGGVAPLPDGRLAWLERRGDDAAVRVVDPHGDDADRRSSADLVVAVPGHDVGSAWTLLPGTVDGTPVAVVASHGPDVARLHVVAVPDDQAREFRTRPADVLATTDLVGGPVAATGLLVADGALHVAVGAHGDEPGHVTRLVADGPRLRPTWRSDGPDDPAGLARAFDPRWLVHTGATLVARDGHDVVGIDPNDGTVDWAWDSHGAQHLVADAVGDALTVAGGSVAAVTRAGHRQAGGRLPGGLDTGRPVEVLAVDGAGRVLVAATDVATGAATVVALDGDDGVRRHRGDSRVDTAIEVARRVFADGSASVAVLARADAYPDALAGGPLAATLGGPLLLTPRDRLTPALRAELARLGTTRVVVLGGAGAVATAVEDDLRAAGIAVERIRGKDRWATAAAVAARVGGTEAYLVEGANADPRRGWPDAVAVSAVASSRGVPILLTARDRLPDATRAATRTRATTVVGGTSAVSAEVAAAAGAVARISGSSRWATSRAVAEHGAAHGVGWGTTWVATGTSWPDALAAGPAAAATGGTLLLVHGRDPGASAVVHDLVAARSGEIESLELVGGTAAITNDVAALLARGLAGTRR